MVTITGRSAGLPTVDKMLIGILLFFNGLTIGPTLCDCQHPDVRNPTVDTDAHQ